MTGEKHRICSCGESFPQALENDDKYEDGACSAATQDMVNEK